MNKLLNSMVVVLVSVVLISCNNQQKSGNTVSYGNPIVEKSYKNEKQEFIESVVSDLKKMLPISDANSTNLVEINMTTNTITYKYEVNDVEFGQNLDSSLSFLKYFSLTQIARSLKNDMNRQYYQALVDCNYGVEIEYHELNTAKRATFRISKSEIQDVLNGKYDDQPTAEEWEELSDALEDLEVYEEDVIEY